MKQWKWTAAAVLIIALCAGALAGCSNQREAEKVETQGQVKEVVEEETTTKGMDQQKKAEAEKKAAEEAKAKAEAKAREAEKKAAEMEKKKAAAAAKRKAQQAQATQQKATTKQATSRKSGGGSKPKNADGCIGNDDKLLY